MTDGKLLSKDSYWMKDVGLPIILSTRVRLARNMEGTSFPHTMSEDEAEIVQNKISNCLADFNLEGDNFVYIPLNSLSLVERKVLIEKHLISPAFSGLGTGRGIVLSESHKVSIMVNEEDHLRIQLILPGNDLREAFRLAGKLDDYLEKSLDLAYKEKFGYLTSCPTNVGTGLRVSAMVHLPALVLTNQVQSVLSALSPLGLAVRGLYGEGSKSFGNIFQISNQITLGKSEEDTLTHLEAVIGQLVEHEQQARRILLKDAPLVIQDKVWRARGILENARLLNSEETFNFLSEDRLGIEMGILSAIDTGFVSLFVNSLQGCQQYRTNRLLEGNLLSFERADFLREQYLRKED